ncbi:9936_t:CDS:2, partial [Gigaspora rosea]
MPWNRTPISVKNTFSPVATSKLNVETAKKGNLQKGALSTEKLTEIKARFQQEVYEQEGYLRVRE